MKHYFIFKRFIHLRKKTGKKNCINTMANGVAYDQRWSQRHKARDQGQGHKRNPRPRTALPRTDPLEAKDMNARGQGHRRKCSRKKKDLQNFFSCGLKKKVFKIILQAIYKILTIQKIVLSSNRELGNFRGLEASRPRLLRPKPRTSKCVLEDVLEAKNVLEDSTSVYDINRYTVYWLETGS